ncbi:Lysosomal Cystine Transporter (LCT) Family [Thraustotheca clavata]|uniref:Lysosomal Cystine Transporter (LCT) Family n=1 Tax=Thraustotheca clavata TaxID=74557 RepID=A0A1W0A6A9_9STRA|nr:Lysosomal Cystine Transporter (LCT) Family [Thraustotheca clavata]
MATTPVTPATPVPEPTPLSPAVSNAVQWIQRNGVPIGVAIIAIIGFGLGFGLDANSNIPSPYNRISSIIGWIYFACWSISFWPQIFLNWRLKNVEGLSLDFIVYNIVGFSCYTVYNSAFYWSSSVQDEYKAKHDGSPNSVQVNDVFFGIHAVVVTLLTLYQTTIYPRGEGKVSMVCKGLLALALTIIILFMIIHLASPSSSFFTKLNWLYLLSYVKLGISLVKYVPQVYLNYKRKSTIGWTIYNVLLDFSGGLLSVVQLLMDGASAHDWSSVTGNPVKFALGFASMFFDVIFMTQHYILYRNSNSVDQVEQLNKEHANSPFLKA